MREGGAKEGGKGTKGMEGRGGRQKWEGRERERVGEGEMGNIGRYRPTRERGAI